MSGRRTGGAARLAALAAVTLVLGCGRSEPARIEVTRTSTGTVGEPNQAEGATTPKIAAGAPVAAEFNLRNAGGRDLVLHGVIRDCGCELTSTLPDTLAPGQAAMVGVSCRAPFKVGSVTREVRLVSDDQAQPVLPLHIEISAEPPAVEPAAVYFGYVPVGGSASRDVTVAAPLPGAATEPRDRSALAAAPTSSSGAIAIEAKPGDATRGRAYVLRFTPTTAGPLHADVDFGGGVHVAVSGVGFRSVLAYPAEVRLPNATTAGGPPSIAIKGVREEPLEIMRIDFPPGLAGDLQAVTPGHEYRLSLRAHGAAVGAAAIHLHTTSASEPEVTIPVLSEAHS